jgi:SAM-dependent methyltransferase
MDDVTKQVSEMYAQFPYPSPQARNSKLKELRNLLTIFSMETHYDLKGKSVLDAGTGTGHRLIEAAARFQQTQFIAVDVSDTSLSIARECAALEGLQNIQFRQCDLMEDGHALGPFDMILCMGVLHHLADPAKGLRNLVRNLSGEGIIFLYIYGQHGGRERMRRKQILALLLNGQRQDFDLGVHLAKELGFGLSEYGWNMDMGDKISIDALTVDAYLNVHETLFEADSIFDLMRSSGLHGFCVYGLTIDQRGCLFDARLSPPASSTLESTNIAAHLRSPDLQAVYNRLSLCDRYRLIDLLFQPNGYTLMGFTAGAMRHFAPESRVLSNALTIRDL